MAKSPDAFRTISEVADWLDTPAHVLRFWESRFSQVKPVKRAGGRRYYRPADMLLLGGIKKLLHEDGMTIKGAQKMLRTDGVKKVSALSQPVDGLNDGDVLDVKPANPATTPPLTVVETEKPAEEAKTEAIPPAPETNAPAKAAEKPQPDDDAAPTQDTEAPATDTKADTAAKTKVDTKADTKEDAKPVTVTDTDTDTDSENDSLSSIYSRLTALHGRMKSDIDPKRQG
ncbi:MAG: MerR family transcriptional regulator [Marinosulfonomonas sp.]|nr:MerR family transcriptional regulator [Marinosulfonomonas sp.]